MFVLALLIATQAEPANPIRDAALAFSDCVKGKVVSVSPSLSPEAGADSVMAACSAEHGRLDAAVNAQLATAPAAQQAEGRKQYAQGMAQGRAGIVEGIRQMRAAQGTPAR